MRINILKSNTLSFSILLLSFLLFSYRYTNKTLLTIEISGIKLNKKGNLRIGIFDKEGFPNPKNTVAGKIITVTAKTMKVEFDNLPIGTYGIAIIQDQDQNGVLSTNLFGYPIEPYGFSKNKFGRFGPPDFNDISFKMESGSKVNLKIEMK